MSRYYRHIFAFDLIEQPREEALVLLDPQPEPPKKPAPPPPPLVHPLQHVLFVGAVCFLVLYVWKIGPYLFDKVFHYAGDMELAALEQIRNNALACELLGEPIAIYRFHGTVGPGRPLIYRDKKEYRRRKYSFHVQGTKAWGEVTFEQRFAQPPLGQGKIFWFPMPIWMEHPLVKLEWLPPKWETMILIVDVPAAKKRLVIEQHPDLFWEDTWSLPIYEMPLVAKEAMALGQIQWWDKWSK